jgi:hypothetical protein
MLNLIIKGYFQNWKYVQYALPILRSNVLYSSTNLQELKHEVSGGEIDSTLIAVHWRGGDYRNQVVRQELGLVSIEHTYSIAASLREKLVRAGKKVKMVCLTDDNSDVFSSAPFRFIVPNLDVPLTKIDKMIRDFRVLMASDYIVCSNSTFSLWASYLSPVNKGYFVPNPWSVSGKVDATLLVGPGGQLYSSGLS